MEPLESLSKDQLLALVEEQAQLLALLQERITRWEQEIARLKGHKPDAPRTSSVPATRPLRKSAPTVTTAPTADAPSPQEPSIAVANS